MTPDDFLKFICESAFTLGYDDCLCDREFNFDYGNRLTLPCPDEVRQYLITLQNNAYGSGYDLCLDYPDATQEQIQAEIDSFIQGGLIGLSFLNYPPTH